MQILRVARWHGRALAKPNPCSRSSAWRSQLCTEIFQNLAANYHFIVIDGAPRVNDLARSAILASNLVLIPVQPSPYDIWASWETVRLIREARLMNAALEAAFLINRKIARSAIGRDAVAALAQFEDVPVLDVHLSQRILYAESAAKGLAVVEVAPQGEAARELRALAKLACGAKGRQAA